MYGIHSKTKGWLLCEWPKREMAESVCNLLNDKLMNNFKKLTYVPKDYLFQVHIREGVKYHGEEVCCEQIKNVKSESTESAAENISVHIHE